jgi:hypothetical protein
MDHEEVVLVRQNLLLALSSAWRRGFEEGLSTGRRAQREESEAYEELLAWVIESSQRDRETMAQTRAKSSPEQEER